MLIWALIFVLALATNVMEASHETFIALWKQNDFVICLFYKELGQNPNDLQLFGTFHVAEAVFHNDDHLIDRTVAFIKVDVTQHGQDFGLDLEHRYPYYAVYGNKGELVKHVHFRLQEKEELPDSANRFFSMLIELTAPPVTSVYKCDEIVEYRN